MLTSKRKEALVNGAKARALVIARLGRDAPLTMKELRDIGESLGMKTAAFESLVWRMADSKTIQRWRDGPVTYYGTKLPENMPEGTPKAVSRDRTVKTGKEKPEIASVKPTIQIDVVKSTGRVRLAIAGMVIEIGVLP